MQMKWKLSRKQLFVGSGLTSGILCFLQYLNFVGTISCGNDPHLTCYFFLQRLTAFGLGLIPVFILSGTMLFMRESIFGAWMKLTYIYIFSLMLIAGFSSLNNGGYIFPSDLSIELTIIIPIFVVISLIVIIWKYLSPRRTQKLGHPVSQR